VPFSTSRAQGAVSKSWYHNGYQLSNGARPIAGLSMNQSTGHSSEVQLFLIVGGAPHSLAHIGPDFVILREPIELPPTDAEVVMLIDGRKQSRWPVTLVNGAVPFDLEIATIDRGPGTHQRIS
jgi:hypothetical protein